MTAKNEHTGDSIQTKPGSEDYRANYDKIFLTKDQKIEQLQNEVRRLQEVISDMWNDYR